MLLVRCNSDLSRANYVLYIRASAPNIRLTKENAGYIQIKDGSIWRTVFEKNWNEDRQKMLCRHFGFDEIDDNLIEVRQLGAEKQIASGDLICYNGEQNKTSCCVHLTPSISTTNTTIPYVRCKLQQYYL